MTSLLKYSRNKDGIESKAYNCYIKIDKILFFSNKKNIAFSISDLSNEQNVFFYLFSFDSLYYNIIREIDEYYVKNFLNRLFNENEKEDAENT